MSVRLYVTAILNVLNANNGNTYKSAYFHELISVGLSNLNVECKNTLLLLVVSLHFSHPLFDTLLCRFIVMYQIYI